MFCNIPHFSVKAAFRIKFMASFLLIKLIIQRQSETLIFKSAISLTLIEIFTKS